MRETNRKLGLYVGIAVFAILGTKAYALRGDGPSDTLSSIRHARTESSGTQVKGTLKCTLAEQNSGEPCVLNLIEEGSGKTYRILNAETAMRHFQDGNRAVTVLGSVSDGEIQVSQVFNR